MNVNHNNEFSKEKILQDIDSYTKKSYILTFLVYLGILGFIWIILSIPIITSIWNFSAKFDFIIIDDKENCSVGISGFWKINSINNDTHDVSYVVSEKWWLIILPIIGYLIVISCSIGTIWISNHRRYKFKIYYNIFLKNFDITNNNVNINKSIFKSNLFIVQLLLLVLFTVSFIIVLVLSLEKPNINFAFKSTTPNNILEYWNWWWTEQVNEIDGSNVTSIYINSKPGSIIIIFMIIELLTSLVTVICNFFYRKYIDKIIMDSIDEIIDDYIFEEEYQENII